MTDPSSPPWAPEPRWPDTPPNVPPVADYPLRPADPPPRIAPSPPAPAFPNAAAPTFPSSAAPATTDPFARPAGPGTGGPATRTVALATVATLLVVALIGAIFALARPPATDAAAGTPPTTSGRSTATTSTTIPDDPFPLLPDFPGGPNLVPQGPPATEAEVREAVADLQSFVEAERGLAFTKDVTVTVLPADEFEARVLEETDAELTAEADELAKAGKLLRALGILEPDTDLGDARRQLMGAGVLGFYDPATEELVVRGEQITPMWKQITVHELTHALDDQHHDLGDDPEPSEDGSDWAELALVEGSAKRVETAFVATLDDQELLELFQEQLLFSMTQGGGSTVGLERLGIILQSPYIEGEPFVTELAATASGTTAVDEAFGAPPTTDEQVLHLEKFLAREPAVPVPAPPADGTVIDEGLLGQYLSGVLLFEGLDEDALDGLAADFADPPEDPAALLALLDELDGLMQVDTPSGWGGDRYVLWDEGSRSCVRVDWVWDSPADAAAFETQVTAWARTDRAATVERMPDDRIRLTRCA